MSSTQETELRIPLHVIAALLLALAVNLPWIGRSELRSEEGRRALPAEAMLATGDYVVPRLFGEPYLAKPPLFYWWVAANQVALESTGLERVLRPESHEIDTEIGAAARPNDWWPEHRRVSPYAARIAAALAAGLLAAFVAAAVGRWSGSAIEGLAAAAFCIVAPEMLIKAPLGEIESTFALFCTAAAFALAAQGLRPSFALGLLSAGLLGAALLAKGPNAIPFALLPALSFAAARVGWRASFRRLAWCGALGVAAFAWWPMAVRGAASSGDVAAHWAGELARGGTGGFEIYLRDRAKFASGVLLGWLPASAFALFVCSRSVRATWRKSEHTGLALHVLAIGLAVLFLWPGTRARYALPLVPFAAVLAAPLLVSAEWARARARIAATLGGATVFAAVVLALHFALRDETSGGLLPGTGASIVWTGPLDGALLLVGLALGGYALRAGIVRATSMRTVLLATLACFLAARWIQLGILDRSRVDHRRIESAAKLDALAPNGLRTDAWAYFNDSYYCEVPIVWIDDAQVLEPGQLLLSLPQAHADFDGSPEWERVTVASDGTPFPPGLPSRAFDRAELWRRTASVRSRD